jgi:hypothetical protein
MYSSVKFFEPMVSSIPLLSGLFWIAVALPPSALLVASVLDVSSPPPHAATVNASVRAASRTKSARSRGLVVIVGVPPSWMPREMRIGQS